MLRLWWLVRYCAGRLRKAMNSLAPAITNMLVRGKQITLGVRNRPGGREECIVRPIAPSDLNRLLFECCAADEPQAAVFHQELIIACSDLVNSPFLNRHSLSHHFRCPITLKSSKASSLSDFLGSLTLSACFWTMSEPLEPWKFQESLLERRRHLELPEFRMVSICWRFASFLDSRTCRILPFLSTFQLKIFKKKPLISPLFPLSRIGFYPKTDPYQVSPRKSHRG